MCRFVGVDFGMYETLIIKMYGKQTGYCIVSQVYLQVSGLI